jgi:N-acetylmuramoyl-L-alanine amidase
MPRLRHALVCALLSSLAACSTVPKTATVTRDTSKTFKAVVIDAGHGGKDNGAFRAYGGAEKTATLDVARRLERDLHESQFKTVMTRSSDVFISLDERVNIGNSHKNSIFVSIHFNDSSRRGIHGYETYYNSPGARELATAIQGELMTIPHSMNRGVKVANFRVLRNLRYPSVLVECGFLSNRREGGDARDAEYRQMLADRVAEGIVDVRYGKGVYRAPAQTATIKPTVEPGGPGQAPSN